MELTLLQKLIDCLKSFPSISKKQAEKLAYLFITKNKKEAEELSLLINSLQNKIHACKECGYLSENTTCYICSDPSRLNILVVVESTLDVLKFEKFQTIKAYYHVLGGLMNISSKNETENLITVAELKERVGKYREVILALNSNLEGLVTSTFIKELLKDQKVTQLAQGIPLGAALEYVDEITLKAALDNRKEIK